MVTKTLRQRALDLLARREYARSELMVRLTPYATDSLALQALLDELSAKGWQSDERFAKEYMRTHCERYGKRHIMGVLRQHCIDESILRTLVFNDEYTTALKLWQKQFGRLPQSLQEKAQQARFLVSHGFSVPVIAKIIHLKAILDEVVGIEDSE